MNYKVLARKYRPQNFQEIVGQETLVETFKNAIQHGRLAHSFLLTGIRGVGKTTTARIIAKSFNCEGNQNKSPTFNICNKCKPCETITNGNCLDVLEIDAASKTGVDNIREVIDSVMYAPNETRFKIYIIDEVHMLSVQAFNALLKTLEEPPNSCKFIFATTEIKKIPLTILSRVNRFDLKRLESDILTNYLLEILKHEGLSAEKEALKTISREAAGSVRDALSILDQVLVNCETKIENQMVNELLGKVSKSDTLYLLGLIIEGKTKEVLKRSRNYIASNTSPGLLLKELLECLHFISISSLMDNELIGDDYSLEEKKLAEKLSSDTDTVILSSLWQILFKGIDELTVATEPITSLEMLLLRACHMSIMPPPDVLIKNVLDHGSDGKMAIYNLERKSSLKTPEKSEIIRETESRAENSDTNRSEESLDSSAVKEILDIFPGAKVKK